MITNMKQPDLNAPRFRPTRLNILNEDLLKRFREKYPQYKDVNDTKLREIVSVFNKLLWQTVITNRDGAELPEGLGFVFIGTCPSPKKFNVDYGKLKENVFRHRNFESDDFLAKIFYTNFANKYKFQNRDLWQFKGHRDFKRATAEAYPENWKMYVQVDNYKLISKMFKKNNKTNWILNRDNALIDENYNEFDMN